MSSIDEYLDAIDEEFRKCDSDGEARRLDQTVIAIVSQLDHYGEYSITVDDHVPP